MEEYIARYPSFEKLAIWEKKRAAHLPSFQLALTDWSAVWLPPPHDGDHHQLDDGDHLYGADRDGDDQDGDNQDGDDGQQSGLLSTSLLLMMMIISLMMMLLNQIMVNTYDV